MNLTAATIFSGGGGAEIGLIQAGFKPVWGIEKDKAITESFKLNFPDTELTVKDARFVDPSSFEPVNLLHVSPPCQQYSTARKEKHRHKEADVGIVAIAFISRLRPNFFSLENVPGYVNSDCFNLIWSCLEQLGYNIQCEIINAADFGVPQSRKRLILRASQGAIKEMERKEQRGWYDAIADLIPELPETELANWQLKHIEKVESRPLLMPRAGTNTKHCSPKQPDEPCNTIRAMRNWKGSHWADIILKESVRRITPAATARLMSFPDSYKLPESAMWSQRILGNAIPPLLMSAIASSFCS